MLQLTYISTAARGMAEAEVGVILAASRNNNAAAGVTGLLLFDGRRFLQALEGEQAAVERTYRRINADPRHRAIVLLSSADVHERAFGQWAMAAERISLAVRGNGIAETVDALTEHVTDLNMRAQFRSFARVRAAA